MFVSENKLGIELQRGVGVRNRGVDQQTFCLSARYSAKHGGEISQRVASMAQE
jgi:hypothetical protein